MWDKNFKKDGFFIVAAVSALSYALFFSLICILKYRAYSYYDFDLALNAQKCWSILQGNPSSSILGIPIWGNSLELISFPIAAIYAVFPSSVTLLVLQSFMVALGAIPLYLLAREKVSNPLALGVVFSYLLNPCLWYANLFEFHLLTIALPFLIFSFYYLEKERFIPFAVFTLLALLCRADIALIIFMLGIYALLRRKSYTFSVFALMLSAVWIIVGVLVIIPSFRGSVRYDLFYGHLGGDFPEIFKNIFLHPLSVLKFILTPLNARFLFHVLFPVCFLSLPAVKELSILIFPLLQHLISLRGTEHTIYFHYTAPLIPFVYISAIFGLQKLLKIKFIAALRKNFLCFVFVSFSLFANFWYGPLGTIDEYAHDLIKKDFYDEERDRLVQTIPKDAPVVSTFRFLPGLANRGELYSFHYIYSGRRTLSLEKGHQTPEHVTYALLDFTSPLMVGSFKRSDSDINMKRFLMDDNWGLVTSAGNMVLFKKGYKSKSNLFEILTSYPGEQGITEIGTNMRLLDKKITLDTHDNRTYVRVSLLLKCLDKMDDEFWILFVLFDAQGRIIQKEFHPVCYGIYPTVRWEPGQLIRDNYIMLVHPRIDINSCSLGAALFPFQLSSLSASKTGAFDISKDAFIELARFNAENK